VVIQHSYWSHGPFSSLIYLLKMVIFHTYVSLLEGKSQVYRFWRVPGTVSSHHQVVRDSATNSKGLGGNGVGIPWHSAEELTHLLLTSKLRRWIKNTWKKWRKSPWKTERSTSSSPFHRTQKDKDMVIWLVVSTYPSEKYDFVSWDGYAQDMENKKCLKPPTR